MQDARKYRKAEDDEMREKWTKTLEQDVEAEVKEADGEQRSGLEKAGTHGNVGMSDPEMGRNMAPGRIRSQTDFEKGNQAEGKGDQTHRQTDRYMEPGKGRRPGAKEAGFASLSLTCSRSLHFVPSPSRTWSRMRSCFGRQRREDGEQVWM